MQATLMLNTMSHLLKTKHEGSYNTGLITLIIYFQRCSFISSDITCNKPLCVGHRGGGS